MKVAVSSTGNNLNSQIDPRFGRCTYFIIVETDDMSFETFKNENMALSGGAGIQSASFISSTGVKIVLTGNCGPKAMAVFSADNIEIFTGQRGTVKEAVERYRTSGMKPASQPTVSEKFGIERTGTNESFQPQGNRRCQGGSGRGMGMGRRCFNNRIGKNRQSI
ncbi:NifB/NifX family molybdenum-iron cluster-binding protein [Desulfobacterales bacterium HSG16]|nr:NifB/NifX family molybdenum-iron cluster-binding protein [Desulfobacterales bacterium HSG16]